jgi:hypothetical protein
MSIVLTPEQITAALASNRERGGHERFLRDMLAKGEMYRALSEFPQYATKSESAVKQGLTNAAKKIDGGNFKVIDAGEDVGLIVVNLDIHAETVADES